MILVIYIASTALTNIEVILDHLTIFFLQFKHFIKRFDGGIPLAETFVFQFLYFIKIEIRRIYWFTVFRSWRYSKVWRKVNSRYFYSKYYQCGY